MGQGSTVASISLSISLPLLPPRVPRMDSICNLYDHREKQSWMPKKRHLPVTLVTGFLGAGKTTLLNHVLTNKHNLRIAAAVNDFAEINIDSQIVRGNKAHDSVVALTNGCLCCSISGEFQSAVWKLLQDGDIGKIDYLLIETSGVSDPHATIATLEQDYGKMYRIRLDTVITVVDTDALVDKLSRGDESGGEGGILGAMAADSQLRCADVVLLNKRDLVGDEQFEMARQFIQSHVPGVQVFGCRKCAVPLHYIMEVNEVAAGPQLVSHEVASKAYTISSEGGVMNRQRQQRQKDAKDRGPGSSSGHILDDDFASVAFESAKPFSLGAFQAVLGGKFPRGVSRMKGTVWIGENRGYLYSFHMSGRQRYELTQCASVGESLSGAFSVQLVAIGRGIDCAAVRALLEGCVGAPALEDPSLYEEARAMIARDSRFEVVAPGSSSSGVGPATRTSPNLIAAEEPRSSFVDFRLTGCVEYGVTEREAANIHGIDFNRMNLELTKRVNGSSGPISLLPVLLPDGRLVCRHAVGAEVGLPAVWAVVQDVGKRVIDEFYRAVGYCKCGM